MGCRTSRERRSEPSGHGPGEEQASPRTHDDTATTAAAGPSPAPLCGLCDSHVHPADMLQARCGHAYHSVCFESIAEGANPRCLVCGARLVAAAVGADDGAGSGSDDGLQHHAPDDTGLRPYRPRLRQFAMHHHHHQRRPRGTMLLFRQLIDELRMMRDRVARDADALDRAAYEPLDPALQPVPCALADVAAIVEDDACAVCQEDFSAPSGSPTAPAAGPDSVALVQLPCRHVFHSACAEDWLRLKRLCPLCRAPAHPSKLPERPVARVSPTRPEAQLPADDAPD